MKFVNNISGNLLFVKPGFMVMFLIQN